MAIHLADGPPIAHRESPSGAQFEIGSGENHARIVEVGGGLRQCTLDGAEIWTGTPIPNDAPAPRACR